MRNASTLSLAEMLTNRPNEGRAGERVNAQMLRAPEAQHKQGSNHGFAQLPSLLQILNRV